LEVVMETIRYVDPGPRLSEATVVGGFAFLSGQIADDPSLDIEGQTRQVLAHVDEVLEGAGSSRSAIVSATIYLANMSDYGGMNDVWDAWVVPGRTPARATVRAGLFAPGYRVEISVIAAT
jgi:enamine deaminase RidA (YjgF/YER057c/UK114 family)